MRNNKHEKVGKTAQVATLLSCICEVNGSYLCQDPKTSWQFNLPMLADLKICISSLCVTVYMDQILIH